ncbi:hypothetical protein DSM104329_02937 [Capillimicrobium parvum]|uniref:Major facilitator superfamily (MFS) profile domain-containing protein n=2 Tax=Capillimicrobium parvum TaxID=2884022 RepID=A0A9E6XZB1_9ACTN|nr:hypothetical protein DSM104329_02937 [Capillimicrobium parvum]
MTAVFAVYPLGVLAALLTLGSLSDVVGRRPVLIGAIGLLVIVALLFMGARSITWLLAARSLQGIATGAVLGAASAAMLDLWPLTAPRAAAVNVMAVEFGIAGGAVAATLLVGYGPAPEMTVFALFGALLIVAIRAIVRLPETAPPGRAVRLRPTRPEVPASVRGRFALVAFGAVATWSVAGVYLALGPTISAEMLRMGGIVPGGLAVGLLSVAAGSAQLAMARIDVRRAAAVGTLALAAGMALAAASLSVGSPVLLVGSSAVVGVGFGLAFGGGIGLLAEVTPYDRRGAVMSTYYVVAYASFGLPVVAVGLVIDTLGLTRTMQYFTAAVIGVALVTGIALFCGNGRRVPSRG